MSERCDGCKHWSRDARVFNGKAMVQSAWGRCSKAAGVDGGPEDGDTLAYAADCSAYGANLNTHETFACVQYASPVIADHDPGDAG